MTTPAPAPGAKPSRVPTPTSGHHDAQWYRRVATKGSVTTEQLPEGRLSDDAAWASVSHLAAGILFYGALGWLLGRWLGHEAYFIAGGVLFGVGLSLFMLFRRLEPAHLEPQTPRTGPDQGSRTEVVEPMSDQTGPRVKESRP